jgi:hypothetical protein
MDKTFWPCYMNVQCIYYCILLASLLKFEAFIREASHIRLAACGALMFLLEPKGYGGESSVGLFYCLNTLRPNPYQRTTYYCIPSQLTLAAENHILPFKIHRKHMVGRHFYFNHS